MFIIGQTCNLKIPDYLKDRLINYDPSNVFYGKINFSWSFLGKYQKWKDVNYKKVCITDIESYFPKVYIIDDGPDCWLYINKDMLQATL